MEDKTLCLQDHHYNALQMAYIGDSVYDLMVRTHQLAEHDANLKRLHKACVACVNAGAQAQALRELLPHLNAEEMTVVQRGRNAKTHSLPKHADPADYAMATALEALFGYLHLNNKTQRMQELFLVCVSSWNNETVSTENG